MDGSKLKGHGPVIGLNDVVVRLGQRTILNGLNMVVEQGEFIPVLGPNGAGKSTLLKLLLGLLKPAEGSVTVLGRVPRAGNREIGYVPQQRILETAMALRARDIVGFGLDGHRWGIGWPGRRRRIAIEEVLREVDALDLESVVNF